ncbi:hypothetical protein GP486_002533 [Trichoglossum hirsutum]|uniref:EKC/KEOPS complex subunit CGI121 n=1 Tax=Trichoglossum hirsutum TaxID=265104 RepID=A0A9P8LET6_9PEZI|nr:hypothetical protein GP486_002533 [Trichoglossum hirsutum]
MAVLSVNLEHTPLDLPIHIALFRNVENSAFLKQQLLDCNEEFEYAFIDASVVISTVHALAAAYRAVTDLLSGRIRSRNVHSEIVFALSPNNNIAESFRRFGISDNTTSLLVIKVSTSPSITHESVARHLDLVVKGTPVEFSDNNLSEMTDISRVRKIYKLNKGQSGSPSNRRGAGGSGVDDTGPSEEKELEIAIIGAIALRGAS